MPVLEIKANDETLVTKKDGRLLPYADATFIRQLASQFGYQAKNIEKDVGAISVNVDAPEDYRVFERVVKDFGYRVAGPDGRQINIDGQFYSLVQTPDGGYTKKSGTLGDELFLRRRNDW